MTHRGVIDNNYKGSISVILVNRNKHTTIQIYQGDRIAQLVIIKIHTGEPKEEEFRKNTTRGTKGFGSTGVNAVVLKKEITEVKHAKEDDDKHTYKLGDQLPEGQKKRISSLMYEYEDTLATNFSQLKLKPPKYLHDCDTGDHPPIKRQPYRTPIAYREWQEEEVAQMKTCGLVEDSNSPWGFPNTIAPKKGAAPGEFAPRMCTDFRPLNNITRKDAYPLPRIDKILDALQGYPEYFSSLDLFSGYYQIGLTK